MKDPNRFYTYAYLREDRTPYYVGKGQEKRLYRKGKGEVYPPKDKSRVIFLKKNLTEEEAFKHEEYMIAVFGRKDIGTGILRNKTNGGEGISGAVRSEEFKRNLSEARKGENHPNYGKTGEKNPLYGKSHSEESKRNQSIKLKGRFLGKDNPMYGKKHTEESKMKMSIKMKGRPSPSEETRRKQSEARKGENNPSYGKKCWNDGCGNIKRSVECPGEGWVLGMGKRKQIE